MLYDVRLVVCGSFNDTVLIQGGNRDRRSVLDEWLRLRLGLLKFQDVVLRLGAILDDSVDRFDERRAKSELVRWHAFILHILVDHLVLIEEVLPSALQVSIRASQDVARQVASLFYLLHRARLAQCLHVGLVQDGLRLLLRGLSCILILARRVLSSVDVEIALAVELCCSRGLLIQSKIGELAAAIKVRPLSNRVLNVLFQVCPASLAHNHLLLTSVAR